MEMKPVFNERERSSLERNKTWQQQPALVEALCMLFHDVDPAQLWSGENPKAQVEYLSEVSVRVEGLPSITDAKQVSTLARDTFHQFFEDHMDFEDWDGLGHAVWQAVQEHRR